MINFVEFNGFGRGRTSHSGKFFIHTEEILESNCRESSVSLGNLKMFLCLNRLMKPVTIAAALKNAAGKFINNLNLTIADKIVHIIVIKDMRPYCLCKIMNIFKIFLVNNLRVGRNEIILMKNLVNMGNSLVRERNPF